MGQEQMPGFHSSNNDFTCNGSSFPSMNIVDVDSMLAEISNEIASTYESKTEELPNTVNPDHGDIASPYKHVSLSFVHQQNKVHKISQYFTYQKQLGSGASCRVLLVTDKSNQEIEYALKEMQKKDTLNRLLFAQEYKVLTCVALICASAQQNLQNLAMLHVSEKLGCGASCRVLLVKAQGKAEVQYALKELQKKDTLNRLLFAQEYKVLNALKGHPNIISFHSCYIDKSCYYLATQFCSGGTMLDRILRQKYFNEQQCSEFMKNVLFGIEHMHQHHIVHRDIKCENLIFDKTGKDGVVKIIDFGNSELITNANAIDNALIGSLHYLPPELLQTAKPRTKASLYKGDMWALGVVCYILVTGKVPFYGKNKAQTLKSIKCGQYDWPQNIKLSDLCKDFISKLLEKDIDKRMSVGEALQHEWIFGQDALSSINFGEHHCSRIRLLLQANKLEKVLLDAILSDMDTKEQPQLLQGLVRNDSDTSAEHDMINYILCHGNIPQELDDNCSGKRTKQAEVCASVQMSVDEKKDIDENDLPETSIASKISIERFEQIMHHAAKEYDVSSLVKQLEPTESGFILLRRISGFHGLLHSEDSNNILIDSFVQSGLAALDMADDDADYGTLHPYL
eukprot:CAMPEP_0202728460 /NCGR_PEP_ID=MMETSP1385-20130828/185637_1 /ASSEMBLY_ACC=CAM_ASM_000861 /TAXON_ID=933848 /ORGANISM="Elphidium margaritaceum" /LENGTH=623 /DNA_ID=CAMNT_0049394709 /DNA_START=25 /DNA_END=1897 /DNA_ORIENTATION=-